MSAFYDVMPYVVTSQRFYELRKHLVVGQLRHILHRHIIGLGFQSEASELFDEAPLRISTSFAPLATVGGKRLAWRATSQHLVAMTAPQSTDVVASKLGSILVNKGSIVVALVRKAAIRIDVYSCNYAYSATDKPVGKSANAAE